MSSRRPSKKHHLLEKLHLVDTSMRDNDAAIQVRRAGVTGRLENHQGTQLRDPWIGKLGATTSCRLKKLPIKAAIKRLPKFELRSTLGFLVFFFYPPLSFSFLCSVSCT